MEYKNSRLCSNLLNNDDDDDDDDDDKNYDDDNDDNKRTKNHGVALVTMWINSEDSDWRV